MQFRVHRLTMTMTTLRLKRGSDNLYLYPQEFSAIKLDFHHNFQMWNVMGTLDSHLCIPRAQAWSKCCAGLATTSTLSISKMSEQKIRIGHQTSHRIRHRIRRLVDVDRFFYLISPLGPTVKWKIRVHFHRNSRYTKVNIFR